VPGPFIDKLLLCEYFVRLGGNTIAFHDNGPITALNIDGTLKFISAGSLSNTHQETPGNTSLSDVFGGASGGFIFINVAMVPATVRVP